MKEIIEWDGENQEASISWVAESEEDEVTLKEAALEVLRNWSAEVPEDD